MVTTVGRTRPVARRCGKEDGHDIAGPGRARRADVDLRSWLRAGHTKVAAPASPNVLLIPGTGFVAHLRENRAAEGVTLDDEALRNLDGADA